MWFFQKVGITLVLSYLSLVLSKPPKSNICTIYGTFWAFLTRRDFFQKSGFVNFTSFMASNFMQKIKLIYQFQDLTLPTDKRTELNLEKLLLTRVSKNIKNTPGISRPQMQAINILTNEIFNNAILLQCEYGHVGFCRNCFVKI